MRTIYSRRQYFWQADTLAKELRSQGKNGVKVEWNSNYKEYEISYEPEVDTSSTRDRCSHEEEDVEDTSYRRPRYYDGD